nr:hypothetical protein [Tanacetum cinerariifolium]
MNDPSQSQQHSDVHHHPSSVSDSFPCPSTPKLLRPSQCVELLDEKEDQDANEATSNRISAPKNLQDRSLLYNMRDYHFKHGSYPFSESKKLQEFYDGWFEGCGVYENVLEMTKKITYLQARYVDNQVKKMSGEDVEGQMDPIDKQIFNISHDIWGLKDDGHGVVNNDNVDDNFGVNDLEDSKESFNQESDGDQSETNDLKDSDEGNTYDASDNKDS